jgi:DNA-binding response OmpR family regulator
MYIITNTPVFKERLLTHHGVLFVTDEEITTDWYDPDQCDLVIVNIDSTKGALTPRFIRAENKRIPIIGISRGSADRVANANERAAFIESGGSYLLQEPILERELFACIDTIDERLRKSFQPVILYQGRLVIRPDCMTTLFDGEVVLGFTGYERKILGLLARNYGRFVHRQDFDKILHPKNPGEPMSNVTEVMIRRIRLRLNNTHEGLAHCIRTVRGLGYELMDIPG